MKNKFILILVLFLVLFPFVTSLGVTPGRTTVDFSSSLERNIGFSILNTENKDINVALRVDGDLKDYIQIDSGVIEFNKGESSKDSSYTLKLPKNLSPGVYKTNIIATEVPKDSKDSGTVVKATVSVITQLHVYVKYPGKYLDARIDTNYNEDSGLVEFFIPVISRGEKDISKASAVIEIYDEDKKIDEIKTDEKGVKSGERKELVSKWDPLEDKGKYTAKVKLAYDLEEINLEKEFLFGPKEINLLGIGVNNFKLGDVARINILVQNNLPEKLSGVFASLDIYDDSLKKLDSLKSSDYEIESDSNEEIVVYWDTNGIDTGDYGSDLKIDYNDKYLERSFKMQVLKDSISFNGVGFVVSNGGGSTSIVTILFIIIGLLVLINLVWLMWWLRQKSKLNEESKIPKSL